jgi:replicative DNA helicase
MSAQQLIDRMVAAEAKVNSWNLAHRPLAIKKIGHGSKMPTSGSPVRLYLLTTNQGSNILKMRAVARRLKREQGFGLLIVDYLQLMVPTATRASDNMVQQVTEISRSLKTLARELDVPVLALSSSHAPSSSAVAALASQTCATRARSSRMLTS